MRPHDEMKVAEVRSFHFLRINDYICGDLQSLLAVPKKRNGACNFPIALYSLSCMDYLGFLTSEKKLKTNGTDTLARIRTFGDKYFSEFAKGSIAGRWSDLTQIFRHGLSHTFFPKGGGVARGNGQEILSDQDGITVLNADALAREVINAMSRLGDDVKNNESLCLRIFDRGQLLANS